MKEDSASWEQFVRGMIERGLRGVRLVVGDRCAGLVSTVRSMLPRAGYQRCMGGGVPFCWTSLSLLFDYATSPSSRRRSMMLMPNSVLMRLSRYQTM